MFVISFLKTIFTAFTAPDGLNHIELASKKPNYLKLWVNSNKLSYFDVILANKDL